MKRFTGLVVITLVLLGCTSAFAVAPTKLGFLSSDMSTLYCNYEEFKTGVDPDGFIAAGYDNLSQCGPYLDGVMIGVPTKLPPSDLPVVGSLYAFADAQIDAYCNGERPDGCFTGDQLLTITGTVPYNIHAPHFGWEVLYNTYDSFYAYLDNWGYLTSDLPLAVTADSKSSKKAAPKTFLNMSHDHNVMGR